MSRAMDTHNLGSRINHDCYSFEMKAVLLDDTFFFFFFFFFLTLAMAGQVFARLG